MKRLLPYLLFIILTACAPKITTQLVKTTSPLNAGDEVIVFMLAQDAPVNATLLGTVKIGDTGFTVNCGWDVVIGKAKAEARKAGGNVLKITDHILPSFSGSSCHRITAQILKVEDPTALKSLKTNTITKRESTWNYAKLFVYRPNGIGSLVGYDLYMDDSLLCRVKNDTKQEIRLTAKGKHTLWAKTESKTEIEIDIEYGREYFLSCTLKTGVMVGRPQLQWLGQTQGKVEYNAVRKEQENGSTK